MQKWLICFLLMVAGNVMADGSQLLIRIAPAAEFLGERQELETRRENTRIRLATFDRIPVTQEPPRIDKHAVR